MPNLLENLLVTLREAQVSADHSLLLLLIMMMVVVVMVVREFSTPPRGVNTPDVWTTPLAFSPDNPPPLIAHRGVNTIL